MKTTRDYVQQRMAELAKTPEVPGRRVLRLYHRGRAAALSWMERHGQRLRDEERGLLGAGE